MSLSNHSMEKQETLVFICHCFLHDLDMHITSLNFSSHIYKLQIMKFVLRIDSNQMGKGPGPQPGWIIDQ